MAFVKCIHWRQIVILLTIILGEPCTGDIDSGCPSWGCLPWGSFSFSSNAPSSGQIKWSTQIDQLTAGQGDLANTDGCVSDQQTVVCATHSGYVSIDPSNGQRLWNYSTQSKPYLPIMDVYGDVIGMDQNAMYYIGAGGNPKHPISIGILKPSFGLMVGNNSILLLTASTNRTAQIFTYGTDGVIDGAIQLTATINLVNGTFIPCSHPIIAGSRAYIVAYFYPDDIHLQEAVEMAGMMRLYAVDLLDQQVPRIKIAWYFNFGRWGQAGTWKYSGLEPIVTYFRQAIYVNMPGEGVADIIHKQHSVPKSKQPYEGSLWAITDTGDNGKLLFRTTCLYGPMAVFDTYDKPIAGSGSKNTRASSTTSGSTHVIWIMNHSPAMLSGHDTMDGSVFNVTGLNDIFIQLNGWITSRLSITRSQTAPDTDVLVFAVTDSTGQAKLVAVEISSDGRAKLRWSTVVGKPKTKDNTMAVRGQIVNVALSYVIKDQQKVTWKTGVIAMVTEMGPNSTTTSAVAVF